MQANKHYRVHAYVCGESCVRYSDFEGWATFEVILQQRPSGCRYVVAERAAERDFAVWDFFAPSMLVRTITQDGPLPFEPPEPIWAAARAEALVMKALALYDRPE